MDFKELEDNRQQPNIQFESIEYMLNIIKDNNLKNILEIGCFNGYSALKFSTVAKEVTSIEINKKNIELAKSNFKFYNIDTIKIIEGDAKDILKNLKDKFDLILIDAMKIEYGVYLSLAVKLVNTNGFIFADNTISHKDHMKDFFDYLNEHTLNWNELCIGRGLVQIKL